MDDFMLCARYASPSQRDVIVGKSEDVPDISHYVSEEIIGTDVTLSNSPVRSYYGSCGEGSPGSSDDFIDDLIEIKEEIGEDSTEISVAVDLAKIESLENVSDSNDNTDFNDADCYTSVSEEVVIDGTAEIDSRHYVFLTEDGSPATSLDDLKEKTVELSDAYSKPKLSYAQLIAEALMSSEDRMLTLSEIYTSVAEKHPYYKLDHSRNWQNAIRHNLTLNKCFTKVPRPATEGRGSFWRLEDGAELTIFKRLLARHQQQQHRVKSQPLTRHVYDPERDIVYVTIPAEND